MLVQVDAKLEDSADFGALGYVVGKRAKNRIPYFRGIREVDSDQLKALGASMAASGAVALYHVEDITPEAHLMDTKGLETLSVSEKDLDETFSNLSTGKEPDIVILGCPHSSLKEIMTVARKLEGKRLKKPLWICTSRMVKEAANRMGFTQAIEAAGGKVVADTCMVVAPIEDMGYKTTAVNSGKAANYLPGFCKQSVVFARLDTLLEKVT
jgi:predicted aconitase